MLGKDEILKRLKENKIPIKNFGVKRLFLIGSYAKGREKNDSDIDFIVEFDGGRGMFDDYSGLLTLLKDIFRKDIDLIKPSLIKPELKEEILGGKKIEAVL